MIEARMGKSLTTSSPEAAEKYQLAVDRILGSETGAAETLDQALALDGNLIIESSPTGARIEISIPKSSTAPITTLTNLSKPRHDESYSSINR